MSESHSNNASIIASNEGDEEKKRKAEEKKKAREAEKAAKDAKFREKEEKMKALKEANEKKAKAKEETTKDLGTSSEPKIRLRKEYVNRTPKGHKKDLSHPMENAYDPPTVESAWYDWWSEQGFFSPEKQKEIQQLPADAEKFVIVIPPPNVTGYLHIGHALTVSVEDALVRYHRMKGHIALWVPGTDHAGIATQVTVEKRIKRERGLTRHDLGRENFVSEVWKWKEEYGNHIIDQLKRTGSSLDWNRLAFTMDKARSKAVTEAFVRLYKDGLIYRDTRLVNWCSVLRTAISDIEVEFLDLEGHTKRRVPGHDSEKLYDFGQLTEFAYKVAESDNNEEVVVATTRVETMLADTAIAIHPEDPRYKHLHGKHVIHPFNNQKLPIICDPILVDMSFGTGVVKVTPAHDPNDYECGVRNKLPMPNLLTLDGKINSLGGKFEGMMRFDARDAVIQELKALGLYRGVKENPMRLGICSRSGDVIEPLLVPQWWVKCDSLAKKSLEAAETGELSIFPLAHKETWGRWLSSIRDWCISRQLWWGHRIPAYLIQFKDQPISDSNVSANWVVASSQEEAINEAVKKTGRHAADIILHQDPDVLDTWFSSALFPFSVMGWPDNTVDVNEYYPTSVIETGHDILFFWIARMVMMGLQLTGKLPFNKILLHAMVRDAHGRKMSKTLGNVIDPIDVIEGITLDALKAKLLKGNLDPKEINKALEGLEQDFPSGIAECGTDAMRFALCAYTSQGRDINLDIKRVEGYRNFCNKIWNATKFILMKIGNDFVPAPTENHPQIPHLGVGEKWILSCLNRAIVEYEEGFQTFDFSLATSACLRFWRDQLCDVYLELVKPILQDDSFSPSIKQASKETLFTCLDIGLKLLHPFMPFLTEELYQRIPRRAGDNIPTISLVRLPAPQPQWENDKIEQDMKFVQEIVRGLRNLRGEYSVLPSKRPQALIEINSPELYQTIREFSLSIRTLSLSGDLIILPYGEEIKPGLAVNVITEFCKVYLDIKDLVDVNAEIIRLEGRKTQLIANRDTLAKKISNPQFSKAPAKIQQETTQKLSALDQEIEAANNSLKTFLSLK